MDSHSKNFGDRPEFFDDRHIARMGQAVIDMVFDQRLLCAADGALDRMAPLSDAMQSNRAGSMDALGMRGCKFGMPETRYMNAQHDHFNDDES